MRKDNEWAIVSAYTRAQAFEDGILVDVSTDAREAGFKYPVALTRGAYDEAIAAGGEWAANAEGGETLHLPNGQDCQGRLWDIFSVLQWEIKRARGGAPLERMAFKVLLDEKGDGRRRFVELVSVCGPGDDAAPVITIMLPGES